MSITPGMKLGGYEIVAAIGAGGMGEVWRARDPRLGREVAIKVLPPSFAANADRLQRFEQEARAAGMLNHPNLLTVFELGVHDGAPYIVAELLEGETLRERLESVTGPVALAPKRALDYAIQIARGLAAVHEKGIIHRDLKPENLFVTKDGRVKILDFGLAKLATTTRSEAETEQLTMKRGTEPGTVMGTAGYMAPEQVRGQDIDQRADLFAFGAILYEMLSGKRAFRGDSSVETMNSILKDDPPELSAIARVVPPGLQRVVDHCLEKNPEGRFQSARDLAFNLEALSTTSETSAARALSSRRRRRFALPMAVAAALALLAAVLIGARRFVAPPQPKLDQLTFRRGTLRSARFAPDGQSILYGAAWEGRPYKIFQTRAGAQTSSPLPMPDADLLSISPSGEMAILLNRSYFGWTGYGTLATVSVLGGAPRPLQENVDAADYAPDGKTMAVVRRVANQDQLEYPAGKPLLRTDGYFSHIRIAPDGQSVAFLEHPVYGDNRGDVVITDRAGTTHTLAKNWSTLEGLAWSPNGKEVWFTGDKDGMSANFDLFGSDLRGNVRPVWRVPSSLTLLDVAKDGRVLLAGGGLSGQVLVGSSGEAREREVSMIASGDATDLSADGSQILMSSYGAGGGTYYSTYLAPTDGAPAVRLGEGQSVAVSPDGKWATSIKFSSPSQLLMLPTGVGQPRTVNTEGRAVGAVAWLPDNRVAFRAFRGQQPSQFFVADLNGGLPKEIPLTGAPAAGGNSLLASTDGKWLLAAAGSGKRLLLPLAGGAVQQPLGLQPGERMLRFADGTSVYAATVGESAFSIDRVDLFTGRREHVRDVPRLDRTGSFEPVGVLLSADAKTYVTSTVRLLNDLYLVEGLR